MQPCSIEGIFAAAVVAPGWGDIMIQIKMTDQA